MRSFRILMLSFIYLTIILQLSFILLKKSKLAFALASWISFKTFNIYLKSILMSSKSISVITFFMYPLNWSNILFSDCYKASQCCSLFACNSSSSFASLDLLRPQHPFFSAISFFRISDSDFYVCFLIKELSASPTLLD